MQLYRTITLLGFLGIMCSSYSNPLVKRIQEHLAHPTNTLDLSNLNLKDGDIEGLSFSGIENINVLLIENNKFTTLPINVLSRLLLLKTVFIYGNTISQEELGNLRLRFPKLNLCPIKYLVFDSGRFELDGREKFIPVAENRARDYFCG